MLVSVNLSPQYLWITTGLASLLVVTGLIILCAGFKRKHKKAFGSDPVQLLSRHDHVIYSEPKHMLGPPNGHAGDFVRTQSPSWRNSSLSRELPAIPDGQESASNAPEGRYGSTSNLYACLDDVRVNNGPDPQSSQSSRDADFVVTSRVHPYERIGGNASSSIHVTSPAQLPISIPSTSQNHAQILQQLDNDPAFAEYRGAQSDMSYTSITVRTPLSSLRTHRLSDDGYTKVPGDENHVYAQVSGEYGGSEASERLGSHIYNELYCAGSGPTHDDSIIDPYATSRVVTYPPVNSNEPVASTSGAGLVQPKTKEELERMYARVDKSRRNDTRQKTSEPFVEPATRKTTNAVTSPVRNNANEGRMEPQVRRSVSSRYSVTAGASSSRQIGESVPSLTAAAARASRSSNSDMEASANAAIHWMDSNLSGFLSNGDATHSDLGVPKRHASLSD